MFCLQRLCHWRLLVFGLKGRRKCRKCFKKVIVRRGRRQKKNVWLLGMKILVGSIIPHISHHHHPHPSSWKGESMVKKKHQKILSLSYTPFKEVGRRKEFPLKLERKEHRRREDKLMKNCWLQKPNLGSARSHADWRPELWLVPPRGRDTSEEES